MNRPEMNTCSITPNPAKSRATLTVSVGVEDIEIVFGTDYKYAKSSGSEEIFAGEEGII